MRSTRSIVSMAPTGKWCRRSIRFSRASRSRITTCTLRPAPCSARTRQAASRSTTAARGASPTRMAVPAFSSHRATWQSCSARRQRPRRAFRPGTTTASRCRSTRHARRTACRAFSRTSRCGRAHSLRNSARTPPASSRARHRAWRTFSPSSTPCRRASARAISRSKFWNCCCF